MTTEAGKPRAADSANARAGGAVVIDQPVRTIALEPGDQEAVR